MKKCPKCKKEKDESEFHKCGGGLQGPCKKCHLAHIRIYREQQKAEKLAVEAEEKRNLTAFRQGVLKQPAFTYQNGYTLNVIPMYDDFKIELCDGQEEMAVLLPIDRTELLKDWLGIKLRKE